MTEKIIGQAEAQEGATNVSRTEAEAAEEAAELLELAKLLEADESQKLGEHDDEPQAESGDSPAPVDDQNADAVPQEAAGETEDETQVAEPAAPDPPVATGWELVRQQERKLREQRAQLDRERRDYQTSASQLETQQKQTQDFQQQLRSDPFGTLKQHGIDFGDLARRYINDDTAPKQSLTQQHPPQTDALAKLQAKLDAMEQKFEQVTYDRQLQDFRSQVVGTLQHDDFELLRTNEEAAQAVQEYCVNYYQQFGEPADLTAAAHAVQDEYKGRLEKLLTTEAIKKTFRMAGSPSEQPSQTPPKPASPSSDGPKSITPSMASGPAPRRMAQPNLTYDIDDETAEAMKLLEGVEW